MAILVRVKLGSPVLFTQDRPGLVGTDGKETVFKMYKFRTMVSDAHELVDKDELFKNHKLENDSRVTKIGRILRNTDMDELPQLINIILGDMSLVGPRPYYVGEIEHHLKLYPEDRVYFDNIFSKFDKTEIIGLTSELKCIYTYNYFI